MSGVVGRSPSRLARTFSLLTLIATVTASAAVAAQSEALPAEEPNAAEALPVEQPKQAEAAKPEQPKAAMSAELAKPAPKPAMSAELAKPVPSGAELTQPATPQAEQPALQAQALEQPVDAQAQPLPVEQVQLQQQVQGPRTLRNLVVPQFTAPPNSRARAAVLQTLADHAEVEVVAIDDVTFASHRLQADPNSPEGRAKLSRELGIDAWLDGQVTSTSAHLTLTAGDGTLLQEVEIETEDEKHLDALTGERMWAVLGTSLSPQEAYRRALLAEYDRGRRKFEARLFESQRQVNMAHEARARRAFVLRAQFALAQRKRAALSNELTRQTEVGKAELAREAEVARLAEVARVAEVARKAEVARQAEAARVAEVARKAEAAKAAELARKAELVRKAEVAKAAKAELARKAEVARKAEIARKAQAAELTKNRRLAAAQAASDKKAKLKNDRAVAKRKQAKRGLGNTSLTNTGAQRAQAKALAKKKKARVKQATSERATQRPPGRSSAAAVGGKDAPSQAQLLSKQ